MHIVIDATTSQDQFASRGIGRFTREIVTRMVEEASKTNTDHTFSLILFNAPTTLNGLVKEHADRVRTINIGTCRLSGKFDGIWWRLQYRPAIKRIIQKHNPDLYYCPYFLRGFAPKDIPTVVMIYDFAFPVIGRYSMAPRYLDWIRRMQYHRALKKVKNAAGVVTISDNTKSDIVTYIPGIDMDKVRTIYLGLPETLKPRKPRPKVLDNYIPKQGIENGYILYYGGLEVNKNVPNLVRSYTELRSRWKSQRSDEPPSLVLAGGDFTRLDMRYPLLYEIREIIRTSHIEDYVFFTGNFEDEHCVDLLNGASLFLHLSLYEGFGFSPLEAMKCGRPVVASNRSCYPEVLRNGALLVDPEDPTKVADACYSVLTDSRTAQTLQKKAIAVADLYTWKRTVRELVGYLEEVSELSKPS